MIVSLRIIITFLAVSIGVLLVIVSVLSMMPCVIENYDLS